MTFQRLEAIFLMIAPEAVRTGKHITYLKFTYIMSKEIIFRLERIDYLIRKKATGTPSTLAQKLGVSDRCLHYYIKLMKEDLKAPIKFCRHRNSYFYEGEGRFHFCFYKE